MTTLPPGFFTEVLTGDTMTGNMQLITEQGGQTTVVPVVAGTIFWNLPDTAHVRLFAVILRPIVPFLEVVECVS